MPFRYASLCDGIGAAHVAWNPIGWRCAWTSEIEPFPCAVVDARWGLPNIGDMTKITEDHVEEHGRIDLVVGGTPCQSFSVAGLRKGMADPRGNLALEFLRLVDATRPRWVVWENVPGVLSSNKGRDFGSIVGALGELGYGWAYRILDAQYVRVDGLERAVPQRRRRVFVVGCLGSWQRAAAVLFERESLCGNTAPRREAGSRVAALTARGVGTCGADDNQAQAGHLIASTGNVSHCLNAGAMGRLDFESETMVAHSLRGEGFDASEDGTGRGTPIVPISFHSRQDPITAPVSLPLEAKGGQAVAFQCHGSNVGPMGTFRKGNGDVTSGVPFLAHQHAVRRLTPRECERLMGFPEIANTCKIQVWPSTEKAKIAARADGQNHRSQSNVLHAAASALAPNAESAAKSSSTPHHASASPAVLSVLIDLDRQVVEINNPEKLLLSANIVGAASSSLLSIPVVDFVRLSVPMLQTLATRTHAGRVESQASIKHSLGQGNGSACVNVSGQEIEELAKDAGRFTIAIKECLRFTTSEAGQSSPPCEKTWQTWSCCVAHVINSCIPEKIRRDSLFALSLTLKHGYTNVPYRGKPAADGPRYKALGNSMAINCMRWIGRRIEMVEAFTEAA